MIEKYKLLAGIGTVLAFVSLMQLLPKQTVVIQRNRPLEIVRSEAVEISRKARREATILQKADVVTAPESKSFGSAPPSAPQAADTGPPDASVNQNEAVALGDPRHSRNVEVEAGPQTEAGEGIVDRLGFGVGFAVDAAAVSPSPSPSMASTAPATQDGWSATVSRADGGSSEPGRESETRQPSGADGGSAAPAPAEASPVPSAPPTPDSEPEPKAKDVLASSPAKPETLWDEEMLDLPDTNRAIQPILAAHPDRDLILCLAGCGGGIQIVEIRRRTPVVAHTAEMQTTAGTNSPQNGDVVCVAGCVGRPGSVVYRNARLSWIPDDGSAELKAALRIIADRVLEIEGLIPDAFARRWVSAAAGTHLNAAAARQSREFSLVGPRVAGWMQTVDPPPAGD